MMNSRAIIPVLLIFVCFSVGAQNENLEKAKRLHEEYKFDQSIALCEQMMNNSSDKEVKDRIFKQMLLSENGQSMLMYSSSPRTVAKKKVPRKDFFLWYSHLKDKSWTVDGNYYPSGAERYFYSENGEIFQTFKKDSTLWSAPEVPSEEMKSAGNEIFPMISPDGKELFFSSDGLFGMGGYDLFVSRWDDDQKKWGSVRNVGFPFSSTADDYLYTVTPDNNYIIFASNRECDKDNVMIYVVRYENYLHKMFSQEEAREMAAMGISDKDREDYKFIKHSFGEKPVLNQEESEPEVDVTFRIGKTSEIVAGNPLPRGISYQIRVMLSNAKVKSSQFKGFSPVFEAKQPSGKYIYYVGIFPKYKDASDALKKVKAKIPGAYIVAYENGKPLQIAKAREKESKITVVDEEVRIIVNN